jgi:cathepsin A (carboxypeptidase C)
MLMLRAITFGLGIVFVASGGQEYLSNLHKLQSNIYDAGLFTPLESLELLSESRFSTLGHPLFPNHSVRIKKTRFCDETVRYTYNHFLP